MNRDHRARHEPPAGSRILDRAGHRLLGVALDADGNQRIVVWQVVPAAQAQP